MSNENFQNRELGDFLKKRRAKISPIQVGITASERRRTPGLRREEVAQLAGIGLTWYTWLEQGRPIQVSAAVLESLSRVFKLDREEQIYLYHLANQPIPMCFAEDSQQVSPALQYLLESMTFCPSLITDAKWQVIAWNQAACHIFGDFSIMDLKARNILWSMFMDKKYQSLIIDWELYAKRLLGRFRGSTSGYIHDEQFNLFIQELRDQSPEFNEWWSLHDIETVNEKYKQLQHPDLGLLEFDVCNFELSDHSGLKMIVHTPTLGTDTEEKMKLKMSMG